MAMRMDLGLQMSQRMELRLGPQIIQSIEILQLPTLELQQRMKQELMENPVLGTEEQASKDEATEASTETESASAEETPYDRVETLERTFEDYSSYRPTRQRAAAGGVDRKQEAMLNTAARSAGLQDYLYEQYRLLDLRASLLELGRQIIYNIDDNGYLAYPLEEILRSAPGHTTEAQARKALRLIQTLDPPGVGARDLRECLLLQIDQNGGGLAFERMLIEKYLPDIEKNRYPKIAKETGQDLERIKQAVEVISGFNPKPGAIFSSEPRQYIIPDVLIEQVDGQYQIELRDDRLPRLYVSDFYSRILNNPKSTEEEREYIRRKIQSARWFIDAIQQRRETVRRITEEIVRVQRSFFDHGPSHLKPLRMRTVAEAAQVHISTVSRAIAEKYVQTPRGIFPLKFFFTGAAKSTEGEITSRYSLRGRIYSLIQAEDKRAPLSDGQICDILRQEGLDLARRTVSKYRKELDIPSSRRRKEF